MSGKECSSLVLHYQSKLALQSAFSRLSLVLTNLLILLSRPLKAYSDALGRLDIRFEDSGPAHLGTLMGYSSYFSRVYGKRLGTL